MKKIVSYVLIAVLAGILTLSGYKIFFEPTVKSDVLTTNPETSTAPIVNTHFVRSPAYAAETTDFTKAAAETVDAVVHVKNTAIQTYRDPLQEFFYGRGGARQYKQVGTGSGVIISSDGYIITNNHVVANATEIQITLNNKKEYKAKLIGTDEANDIALVKIDEKDLPYLPFANSDTIKIGEWVLAVGNPYNLTSTVTAGIVSAKGRDLDGNNRIESYIQTDAAVNPGNSGGALVNTRGELIGINSAISSQTGSFVGYSFAVPSNIARKVVEDLMEFGNVQRAVLGINIIELNGENYENLGASVSEGIYVKKVLDKGSAADSGLKEQDIIIKVNDNPISKFSELKGQLSSHRPGETVQVTVIRNGEEISLPVLLKNKFGKEELGATDYIDNVLGMELKNISDSQKKNLNINYGVRITKIKNPSFERFGIKKGAIILGIEREKVFSVDDVERLLRDNENNAYVTLQILNTNNKIEYISLKL